MIFFSWEDFFYQWMNIYINLGGSRKLGISKVSTTIGTIKIVEQDSSSKNPRSSRWKRKVDKSPSISTIGKGKEKCVYEEDPMTPQPQIGVITMSSIKRVNKELVWEQVRENLEQPNESEDVEYVNIISSPPTKMK